MMRRVDDHENRVSFYTSCGCDVFLFNYRGYGRSGGNASPGNINGDVREVVEYLREQAGVTRLAVHGESIGGVAAASVARNSQVSRAASMTAVLLTQGTVVNTDVRYRCMPFYFRGPRASAPLSLVCLSQQVDLYCCLSFYILYPFPSHDV